MKKLLLPAIAVLLCVLLFSCGSRGFGGLDFVSIPQTDTADEKKNSITASSLCNLASEYSSVLMMAENRGGVGEIYLILTRRENKSDAAYIMRITADPLTEAFIDGESVAVIASDFSPVSFYDAMIAGARFRTLDPGEYTGDPADAVALRDLKNGTETYFIDPSLCGGDIMDTKTPDEGLRALFRVMYEDRGDPKHQHFGMS